MTLKKKLQVFISSTYKDLIPERQAAVEAILTARHIPAGMELFSAGNESQAEVVRRWIDESDVYMLMLLPSTLFTFFSLPIPPGNIPADCTCLLFV